MERTNENNTIRERAVLECYVRNRRFCEESKERLRM